MWQSIRKNVDWRAIPIAGLAAGTVFLLVNLMLTPIIFEIDSTLPLRYIASLVLGESAVTDDGAGGLVIGVIVHYVLSIVFTLVIAIVIHRWGLLVGIIGGAILGASIYSINLYTFTVFFEWFFAINSEVMLISHIFFGATAGGIYELFDHYDTAFLEVSNGTA